MDTLYRVGKWRLYVDKYGVNLTNDHNINGQVIFVAHNNFYKYLLDTAKYPKRMLAYLDRHMFELNAISAAIRDARYLQGWHDPDILKQED